MNFIIFHHHHQDFRFFLPFSTAVVVFGLNFVFHLLSFIFFCFFVSNDIFFGLHWKRKSFSFTSGNIYSFIRFISIEFWLFLFPGFSFINVIFFWFLLLLLFKFITAVEIFFLFSTFFKIILF